MPGNATSSSSPPPPPRPPEQKSINYPEIVCRERRASPCSRSRVCPVSNAQSLYSPAPPPAPKEKIDNISISNPNMEMLQQQPTSIPLGGAHQPAARWVTGQTRFLHLNLQELGICIWSCIYIYKYICWYPKWALTGAVGCLHIMLNGWLNSFHPLIAKWSGRRRKRSPDARMDGKQQERRTARVNKTIYRYSAASCFDLLIEYLSRFIIFFFFCF